MTAQDLKPSDLVAAIWDALHGSPEEIGDYPTAVAVARGYFNSLVPHGRIVKCEEITSDSEEYFKAEKILRMDPAYFNVRAFHKCTYADGSTFYIVFWKDYTPR